MNRIKPKLLKLDIINENNIKELINDINNGTNIKENILQLCKQVKNYPLCTCGNPIYFPKMVLTINRKNQLVILTPSVFEHMFKNKKFALSKCYDCVKEYFKDDMPSMQRYLFQIRYRWAKFIYDIPEEIHKQIRSDMCSVTLESCMRKHGKEKGKEIYEGYCKKQSETNTFEYKQQKYGWTKEQFDEFNKSRAVTEENLIRRHGKEKGLEIWNEYRRKQSYNTKYPYFIEKYGKIEGEKRYFNFCQKRAQNSGWSQDRSYSKVSQELFNNIAKCIPNNELYYATLNKEYYIRIPEFETGYMIDFYDKTRNLIIEFQGDYWHCNPKTFNKDYFNETKKLTAKEIWENDKLKKDILLSKLNNPIYIEIWESDYYFNKEKIIKDILSKYYNIK